MQFSGATRITTTTPRQLPPALRCPATNRGPQIRRPATPIHAVRSLGAPSDNGERTYTLQTIYAGKRLSDGEPNKANFLLPKPQKDANAIIDAAGVVLFMHGFFQAPPGYAHLLTELANEKNLVIIAPVPPKKLSPENLQDEMVAAARFWHERIVGNSLPGIQLEDSVAKKVHLLAHSVGGGLAPYVATEAAKHNRAFVRAQVMAPQTSVVKKYNYSHVDTSKLADSLTKWRVQYGVLDMLSPLCSVKGLCKWLAKLKKPRQDPDEVLYRLGTHVGFEDQFVWYDSSFVADKLPWVLAIGGSFVGFLAALLGGWLPLMQLYRSWQGVETDEAPTAQLKKGARINAASPLQGGKQNLNNGIGEPEVVTLQSETSMFLGYILFYLLVMAFAWLLFAYVLPVEWWDPDRTAIANVLYDLIKIVLITVMALGGLYLAVYPYETWCQRPRVIKKVQEFFG